MPRLEPHRRRSSWAPAAAGVLLSACLVLAGCATYAPLPLPTRDDLAVSVAPQGVPPLGMNAVATLAVLNSPVLRAARGALHVAQAQAFAAGLLPDPEFSYSGDFTMDHVTSPADPRYPEYDAYGLGLSVDLRALLTHRSRKSAASASLRQARLDLLWQEWQTVAEARTLYVEQAIAVERRTFLTSAEKIYSQAYARSQRALAAGNVTLEQTSADLALLLAVRAQLGAADRSLITTQQGLRALLGVQADVVLPLKPLAEPVMLSRAAVRAGAARLPRSRPDLRALAAGYRAEEQNVRTAILAQFPNISLGVTRARDVSDVHTTGFGVTLTLPIFNRGRGDIAIQRATRGQLRAEYLARLDQSTGDVWRLWNETEELRGEARVLDARLPRLKANVDGARDAFDQGIFPAASYFTLVSSYLTAEATRADLLQNLWSDSIALATTLGTQVEPRVPARAGAAGSRSRG
ncbi:MAG: TolC family protein [Steroidobacteraceae bacterium]